MSQKSPLIVVIDDTEATRYAVRKYLEKDGFVVRESGTGLGGLDLVNELTPDLVVLDIHLPDIMGFEVCKRIKANPKTARIPVLQISASYVTSTDRITGLEGGADSYLTHPVEPPVLIATVRALLRYRAVHESLNESNARLRVALNAAPVALYELDANGTILWIHHPNSPHPVESMVGKPVFEISTEHISLLEAARSTGCLQRKVLKSPFRDLLFDVSIEPKMINGEIVGYNCAALDVTLNEQARVEVQAAKEEAERANRAKSQFIANVSHEIRTPLGVIMGFSDLVLSGQQDKVENENALVAIKRNAIQLSKLVDEILDLSKLEADRMEIENIRFNLPELVSDVVQLLERQARSKNLNLRVDFTTPIPEIVVSDPTRLRQILINLLGNAIKFTEKGSVALKLGLAELGPKGSPIFIKLDVTDTGIGITQDQAQKLFTAFSQADESMSRRFGGTGLGLMLSRRLAQAVGGDLILSNSEAGKGSTFTLTFPTAQLDGKLVTSLGPQTERTAVSQIPRLLEGTKILLVEDSPDNQVLVGRVLRYAGAEVRIASNGREGVEFAMTSPFDVVLMDIQMPELDGYEAAKLLREKGYPRPVIALTAHALKGERERCLASGFADYLTKPLDRNKLIETIISFTREQSANLA